MKYQFKPSYYTILKIEETASQQEIKKAYRVAVKKYHPDSSKKDTQLQFLKVQEAYDCLANTKIRLDYDLKLLLWKKERRSANSQQSQKQRSNRNTRKSNSQRKRSVPSTDNSFTVTEILVGSALIFGAGYLFSKMRKK